MICENRISNLPPILSVNKNHHQLVRNPQKCKNTPPNVDGQKLVADFLKDAEFELANLKQAISKYDRQFDSLTDAHYYERKTIDCSSGGLKVCVYNEDSVEHSKIGQDQQNYLEGYLQRVEHAYDIHPITTAQKMIKLFQSADSERLPSECHSLIFMAERFLQFRNNLTNLYQKLTHFYQGVLINCYHSFLASVPRIIPSQVSIEYERFHAHAKSQFDSKLRGVLTSIGSIFYPVNFRAYISSYKAVHESVIDVCSVMDALLALAYQWIELDASYPERLTTVASQLSVAHHNMNRSMQSFQNYSQRMNAIRNRARINLRRIEQGRNRDYINAKKAIQLNAQITKQKQMWTQLLKMITPNNQRAFPNVDDSKNALRDHEDNKMEKEADPDEEIVDSFLLSSSSHATISEKIQYKISSLNTQINEVDAWMQQLLENRDDAYQLFELKQNEFQNLQENVERVERFFRVFRKRREKLRQQCESVEQIIKARNAARSINGGHYHTCIKQFKDKLVQLDKVTHQLNQSVSMFITSPTHFNVDSEKKSNGLETREKMTHLFKLVADLIGSRWRILYHHLPFHPHRDFSTRQNDLDSIDMANRRIDADWPELCYKALMKWNHLSLIANHKSLKNILEKMNVRIRA